MGHVAKHSAGAGSNRDRSAPPSKPTEAAEIPAEPVAVKPGEPADRPDAPASAVVVEPMDPARAAMADRTVLRPTVPGRATRRWWQFGRGDGPRPASHAAGAKSRTARDEHRRPPATDERDRSRSDHAGWERPAAGRSTSHARPEDSAGTGAEAPFRWRPAGSDGADQASGWNRTPNGARPPEWDRPGNQETRPRYGDAAADAVSGWRPGGSSHTEASNLGPGSVAGFRRDASEASGLVRTQADDAAGRLYGSGVMGAGFPAGPDIAGTDSEPRPDSERSHVVGVKLKEGQRSSLRPTAPTGTPTYEGEFVEDTAVLPKIGQPIETQRIWTSRPELEEDGQEPDRDHDKDGRRHAGEPRNRKKIDVTSLLDVGMKLLPETEPEAPDGPITNARWAALVRAAARRLIWTLPTAGVVAAAASIGAMVRGGPAHYLSGAEPFRLVAWVTSVWLGMVAMICLVGVLAAVRSRAAAVLGLQLGILGGVSMLMFAAVPPDTPIWGLSAKTLTLTCGAFYSAGWMAMGWAVFRSRMFSRGDGLMLVLCGPMVGIAGLWMSPFHTAGALLMSAAGLGIAWKSNSTLRAVRAGREADRAERAGPPLELAEIRPRRQRGEKPPKPPKPAKAPKRGKQPAETDPQATKPATANPVAGARSGADAKPGADTKPGAGTRFGVDTRSGAGTGRGTDAGGGTGARPGTDAGHAAGRASGADAGHGAGTGPGTDTGPSAGARPGADAGHGAGSMSGSEPGHGARGMSGADTRSGTDARFGAETRPGADVRPGAAANTRPASGRVPFSKPLPPAEPATRPAADAKPAKEEKPPAAPRRPGKRRLRLGAATRENKPPDAPAPDRDRKR